MLRQQKDWVGSENDIFADIQYCIYADIKLNYRKKVFYFALNFLPWEFLLIKKLDFEKTKAT